MIRGLTTAGLGEISSNEEYIRLASQFGFRSIDVNPLELVQQYGKDGAVQLLESHGVMLGSFGLEVDWRTTEDSFRRV